MENDIWKIKAIERTHEIKALKKRVKEVTTSRDSWKQRATTLKSHLQELESSKKKIKHLLS